MVGQLETAADTQSESQFSFQSQLHGEGDFWPET